MHKLISIDPGKSKCGIVLAEINEKYPGKLEELTNQFDQDLRNKLDVEKNKLKEVIIATSATVEGQTTAHYIEDEIKNSEIKISKLGQGLPVGGEIEQLDDGTLVSAFKNRVPVSSE